MAKGAATRKRVKLGDIVERHVQRVRDVAGYSKFVGVDHLDTEDLRLRRHGVMGVDEIPPTFRFVFREGMVLVPTRRPRLRKCAVAPFEGLTGEKLLVLKPIARGDLHPGFVAHLLASPAVQDWNIGKEIGSVTPHFRWADMAEFEFELPALEEQRRIVAALSAVEESLQALCSAERSANNISRRLLEAFEIVKLPLVPVEALVTDGPRNGVSPKCNDQQRGRPTLAVGCVYTGIVNTMSELKYSEIDDDTFDRFRLRRDDILVVRGNGNRELVGRAGIVVEELSDCFYPDLLIRLRFDRDKLDPALAVHLWNCVPLHADLIRRAKSTNGIYKINGADIRAHRLPVPPKAMQSAMLDAVKTHAQSLRLVTDRVAASRQLKSSVLKSLTGEA